MELSLLRQKLEQRKGRRQGVMADISSLKLQIRSLRQKLIDIEEAQMILKYVAQQTQSQLQYHISGLVSLALAAVFEDPYEFKVEFIERRGKTEADLLFERDGQQLHDPTSAAGMGACDVAALGFRVALWSLRKPKTRSLLVLDEPCRNLKGKDLPAKAGEMLRMLTRKVGLQIIMVSHTPDIIDAADRVFDVTMKNGVSEVERIKN